MKTLEPLGNHVLIEPKEVPSKSAGGLHLPEQYKTPGGEGMVIAVGPGRMDYAGRMVPIEVRPGDFVVYTWIHGRTVEMDGKQLKVLDAGEILAVWRHKPEAACGEQ